MNITLTRYHIDKLLAFLTPSLQFVNCHMVEFITGGLWDKFIPNGIKREIKNDEDIVAATKLFLSKCEPVEFPNIQKFIIESEKYRLECMDGVLLSSDALLNEIGINNLMVDTGSVNIKEFMNEKKNHEVDIVSRLVSTLTTHLDELKGESTYVLDAGDGKGYLSSRLALQYNLKVLGIDASELNTQGSQKRLKKLERAWSGLKERTELISQGIIPPRRPTKRKQQKHFNCEIPESETIKTYKSINCYITKDTNFEELIKNNFNVQSEFAMCLTGLHTCGNLAPTCLEAFATNPNIRLLCNVGCCYHLLSELFYKDSFTNTELISRSTNVGFPMSEYLKSKEIKIGRNARMLASQSIHRTQLKDSLNTQSLFYRALLEVIIQNKYPELTETPRVGKVKKFSNFKEYLQRCDEKCCLGLSKLEPNYVEKVMEEHKNMELLITLFYLIRMSYAQSIESLILLDRLLFLKENGVERTYLIRLFDPVMSPRCYGLLGIK